MYLDGGRRYPPTSSITSSNLVLEVTLCMSLRYSSVVLGNADQAKTLADKVHFLLLLHASAVHRYMYTVLYHLDHRSFPHLDASGQYKFDLYQELARLTMFHILLIKPE